MKRFLQLWILLLFIAAPLTAIPVSAQEELYCDTLNVHTTTYAEGDLVSLANLQDIASISLEMSGVVYGLTDDEAIPLHVLDDGAGTYFFVVPLLPYSSDGHQLQLTIRIDELECDREIIVEPPYCETDGFANFIDNTQQYIDAAAARYGYSHDDLLVQSPDAVAPQVEDLVGLQYIIDHPDNPNAFKNLLTVPEVNVPQIDCWMSHFEIVHRVEEMADYYVKTEPLPQLNLFKEIIVLDSDPDFQDVPDQLTPDQLAEYVADQKHVSQQFDAMNDGAVDVALTAAGKAPPIVSVPATIFATARGKVKGSLAKIRDTLPSKALRFNVEMSNDGPLPEDFSGTITVKKGTVVVENKGYSSDELGDALTAFSVASLLASGVPINGGMLRSGIESAVGDFGFIRDIGSNVLKIDTSLSPEVRQRQWAVTFEGDEIDEFLMLLPGRNAAGKQVFAYHGNNTTELEVVGNGKSDIEIRTDSAILGMSSSTTISITVQRIEVDILESSRAVNADQILVDLEGSIDNAETESGEWKWVDPETGVVVTRDFEQYPIISLIFARPQKAWEGCVQPSSETVDVTLTSTTVTGARRPAFREPNDDRIATHSVTIPPQETPPPPECDDITEDIPEEDLGPIIKGSGQVWFASAFGVSLGNVNLRTCVTTLELTAHKADLSLNLEQFGGAIFIDAPLRLWIGDDDLPYAMQPFANWHGDPDGILSVNGGISARTLPLEALDARHPDVKLNELLDQLHMQWRFLPIDDGEWYLANYTEYTRQDGCASRTHYIITFGFQRPPDLQPFIDVVNKSTQATEFLLITP